MQDYTPRKFAVAAGLLPRPIRKRLWKKFERFFIIYSGLGDRYSALIYRFKNSILCKKEKIINSFFKNKKARLSKFTEENVMKFLESTWDANKEENKEMNNQEKLFIESNKLQNIAQKSICAPAEKWLNIAFKLDYISLSCKERIDALLKKVEEIQHFHIQHVITDQDVTEMMTITKIAANTRFSQMQLESIEKDTMV